MSVVNAIPLIAAGDDGYSISRSLRFRSSASAYLNRTPASAGNRKTWTMSMWLKRGALSTYQMPFSCFQSGGGALGWQLNTDNTFDFYQYNSAYQFRLVTTPVFRDPSAWYHFVFVVDTTQATASNRIKVYVNGVQITAFSTATYPTQNTDLIFNYAQNHNIGQYASNNTNYFDGYLTEINFIDGQALDPSYFGVTDPATGVWSPAKYTGTYGTNGFYLNFSDNSAATAAAIGKDNSGNGNNWTPNNISVTAGSTYDSMTDVPTLTSATAANFAVISPLWPASYSNGSITNGNLTALITAISSKNCFASMPLPTSGKIYYELTSTYSASGMIVGVTATPSGNDYATAGSNVFGYYNANGNKCNNGTGTAYGTAWYTSGQIYTIGVAYDADAGTLVFYLNNTSQGTAFTLTTGVSYFPTAGNVSGSGNNTIDWNFGQRPFAYTPPTGYLALNTFNLPSSIVPDGRVAMAATLYTGTGASQSINNTVNGVSFQPDLVWAKNRSNVENHQIFDSVRGVNNALYPNLTNAAGTDPGVTAFNSNGFSLGGTNNTNAQTYVGWQWKAGGTAVSNTAGSITSSVSANPTAGFSVVTWTGNGSTSGVTIGHGLGVAPSMVILKSRTTAGQDWLTYHVSVGNTKGMYLNSTAAATTNSAYWNNTTPTSTVFTTTGNTSVSNQLGQNYITYCFAPVAGYSAFGSYTGNGSTDGPFVYCGFRPRYVMIKVSSGTTGDWELYDTSRDTYNASSKEIWANSSNAERSVIPIDILSNGFKPRDSSSNTNGSGFTYIYMAFAENPFKYANAR